MLLCDTYFKAGVEELFTAVRKENSSDLSGVCMESSAQNSFSQSWGKKQSWCLTPSMRHIDQKLQYLHSFSPNGKKKNIGFFLKKKHIGF